MVIEKSECIVDPRPFKNERFNGPLLTIGRLSFPKKTRHNGLYKFFSPNGRKIDHKLICITHITEPSTSRELTSLTTINIINTII